MNKFGLTPKQRQIIENIFLEVCPNIQSVRIFGSRATGKHKDYSDIDLVIYGEDAKKIDTLWTYFNESSLPYKVDLCSYETIKSPLLKKHIDDFAKEFIFKKCKKKENGLT